MTSTEYKACLYSKPWCPQIMTGLRRCSPITCSFLRPNSDHSFSSLHPATMNTDSRPRWLSPSLTAASGATIVPFPFHVVLVLRLRDRYRLTLTLPRPSALDPRVSPSVRDPRCPLLPAERRFGKLTSLGSADDRSRCDTPLFVQKHLIAG